MTKTYTFVKTTGGHKHRRDECLSSKKFLRNLLREHVNYIMTHYSHYVTSSRGQLWGQGLWTDLCWSGLLCDSSFLFNLSFNSQTFYKLSKGSWNNLQGLECTLDLNLYIKVCMWTSKRRIRREKNRRTSEDISACCIHALVSWGKLILEA